MLMLPISKSKYWSINTGNLSKKKKKKSRESKGSFKKQQHLQDYSYNEI